MNSAAKAADGYTALFIDGINRVDVTNLCLTGNNSVQIDKFLFKTFYGGDDKAWRPQYTNYIEFDIFSVMHDLIVTGSQGKECEDNNTNGVDSCYMKACGFKSYGSGGATDYSGLRRQFSR
jgi:hypothetical protein